MSEFKEFVNKFNKNINFFSHYDMLNLRYLMKFKN